MGLDKNSFFHKKCVEALNLKIWSWLTPDSIRSPRCRKLGEICLLTPWDNDSGFNSRSEGCVFNSRRFQKRFCAHFCLRKNVTNHRKSQTQQRKKGVPLTSHSCFCSTILVFQLIGLLKRSSMCLERFSESRFSGWVSEKINICRQDVCRFH